MANDAKIQEYRDAVLMAKMCANMLAGHDIAGLLNAIEHAHALGPILDPTLYRDSVKAMDEDAELLRAALALRKFGTAE